MLSDGGSPSALPPVAVQLRPRCEAHPAGALQAAHRLVSRQAARLHYLPHREKKEISGGDRER